MIESNLAVQANYDWIEHLIKRGYDVFLFFLCTQFITINIKRVQKRVLEGGHHVDETANNMAVIKNGLLEFKDLNSLKWVNDVLFITEKLQNRKNYMP